MDDRTSQTIDFAHKVDFSQILTNPILDIAARIWDKDRYEAFKVCYRSMRIIDDLVDDRKAEGQALTEFERSQLVQMILGWLDNLEKGEPVDDFQSELLATITRFKIPLWPWQRLARAMIYDLHHESFPTFLQFLRYSEGAAVSPASIFVHLCGVSGKPDSKYQPPEYDIRLGARPLALFSYLVHIIRDFEKDTKAGLNYYADDIIVKHGLSVEDLVRVAQQSDPTDRVRKLIGQYHSFADYYRAKARSNLDGLLPLLDPRYQLSLELIYDLYLQIYERVDPKQGQFTGEALNPTPAQIQLRIDQTIASFRPLS